MSVGPLGGIGASVAGSPLQQAQGSEVERAGQDATVQQRRVQTDQKAESAAGVGEADGDDHEAEERDADGRRLWEEAPKPKGEQAEADDTPLPPQRSKDATGESGNLLDLSG